MIRRAVPVLAALLVPAGLLAQQSGGTRPVVMGGEIGSYLEVNGISGAERRRPAGTGRVYLRPSISLFGKFSVAFDLMLSTEGEAFQGDARQRLNQYSVNPSWRWGEATLGDFTDRYTPLTFNGIRVRGAGVELRRGAVTVQSFGGRTQRAVPGGAVTGRYSRTAVGGRLGLGDPDRTSLGFVVLRARDDVGSLEPPTDTLFPDVMPDTAFVEDTLQVGLENRFAVTPQENVVVAVTGGLALFGDRLALKGEVAGSGYTRDLRSDVIESQEILDRIPGIAQRVFTPRVSSAADYAYTIQAQLRPIAPLTTIVSYRYLGPGYTSLGAASLLSDRRDVDLKSTLRFRRLRASVSVGHQRDNLVGQKAFTTGRNRLAATLAMRVTRQWSTSVRLNRATLGNDASEPERWIAYSSWQTGVRQTLAFGRQSAVRSASVDYGYRTTGDDNPLRAMNTSRAHSVSASVVFAPRRNISITPSMGLVRSRFADGDWDTRTTYGVGAQWAALRGTWVSSLNLGRSQFQQTGALQGTLSSRYQLTQRDAVILTVRGSDYDNITNPDLNFQEVAANLRWVHRF